MADLVRWSTAALEPGVEPVHRARILSLCSITHRDQQATAGAEQVGGPAGADAERFFNLHKRGQLPDNERRRAAHPEADGPAPARPAALPVDAFDARGKSA